MASTRPRPGIGSPAYTSNIPRRPSIRAAPWVTSRSTQPSTVGILATSGLGAAAGVVAGAEIEPVTSFAAAGVVAADTATGVPRSLSTASLSLASLAAGSACAFSTLSRRSLVLLNWAVPVLEIFSRLAISVRMSASIRATDASSVGLADAVAPSPRKCPTPAVASAPPSAPAIAASATTAASAANRRLPNIPEPCSASGAEPARPLADMIVIVPGMRRASAFGASGLRASALGASALGASALGASALGTSTFAVSTFWVSPGPPCSGDSFGESTLVVSGTDSIADTANGVPDVSREPSAALREPDSPLF